MGHYYYLAESLSPLEFPILPAEGFFSLLPSLQLNLSRKDWEKVCSLRLFVDILNIRPLFLAEELDPRGNLVEKDLDEALVNQHFFPQYVFDFLNKEDTLDKKIQHFPELLARFFREEIAEQKGFLRSFFAFEREWRLIVLALRAKAAHRDYSKELQFEDPTDFFVMQILLQKDAEEYTPPAEYSELKDLFLASRTDLVEQSKNLSLYRFNKIGEMVGNDLFSIDSVLAYLAKLMIIEYWNELDQVKGKMILDTFKIS